MLEWIGLWWTSVWQLLVDSAVWLLAGFGLAGFVYVALPVEQLTKHLSRPGLASVIKAAVIGIPLPLCSCSVIPVATSIRRQGAGKGAYLSFIISTPETGADSIAISYALLGPVLAVVRPIAAAVTAIVAGTIVDAGARGGPQNDATQNAADGAAACCDVAGCGCETTSPGSNRRWVSAIHYGFVDMFADLAPWLILGFAFAGLAGAVLPSGFLERHVGTGLPAMLLMLVVGLPLYVCATSSTPIAAALIAKGLSPGAALVFLLVGPATNMATMIIVARDVGRRGVAVYLAVIAVVAVAAGLIVDAIGTGAMPARAGEMDAVEPVTSVAASIAAVVLLVLIANGVRVRIKHALAPA